MREQLAMVWAVLTLAAGATMAPAATWQVEKDGSGDFTVIQAAVTASSAGDTILIGPGRYDDFHTFVAPAWQTEVIVDVTKDDLTFIGAGRDVTIIGPEEMYDPGVRPEPMAVATVDTVVARFERLAIENARNGIYWAYGRVEIEDCRFEGCQDGVYIFCEGGASVRDSEFYSEYSIPIGIVTFSPCGPVNITGCVFGGPDTAEQAVSINSTMDVNVSDCEFTTRTGVVFSGSTGRVTNCRATSAVGQAIWVTSASYVELADNQLHGNYSSLDVDSGSRVVGTANVFTGGQIASTIDIASNGSVQLTSGHILKSGILAVETRWFFETTFIQDLTGNYWGTTDTDSIDAWIQDMNDDPAIHSVVDYLPIAETPLPAKRSSLGGIKALFR